MSSIVTNVSALNAQRNLGVTGMKMGKVLEKLSSGYRINRAADDAAGLGISEKMRAQVRGNAQAIRNAQDGISMIQTAEGAMDEVHSILQRMRELAVQAANDTYDTAARDSIATEMAQLRTEVDRIANGTEFNGQKLLTGNLGSTPASVTGGTVGAGDVAAQSVVGGSIATSLVAGELLGDATNGRTVSAISLDNAAMRSVQPGDLTFSYVAGTNVLTATGTGFTGNATLANLGAGGGVTATLVDATTGAAMTLTFGAAAGTWNTANNVSDDLLGAGITGQAITLADSATNHSTVQQVSASSTTVGATYTLAAVAGNPTKLSVSNNVNADVYQVTVANLAAGSNVLSLGGTGITLTLTASAAVEAESVVADLTKAGQNTIVVTGATGGAVLQVGANVTTHDEMSISFNDVRASSSVGLNLANQNVTAVMAPALTATVAVDFATTTGVTGIVGSNDRAQAMIYVVDQAIQTLNSRRATLGANQNRLEHTVNSLGVAVENLTASESRIRDADIASLSSQLVSAQILSQAGTAVLSQANQSAQSVLSLLK
jgi:flagellin